MTINARSKGNRGENEVAKLLQAWWRRLEPEARFFRTPSSGGWSTPELRGATRTAGDVTTTSQTFPFTTEVKRNEGWSWPVLLAGKPSPVLGWWRQAWDEAEEEKRRPLLLFRHSREPWHAMIEASLLGALGWDGSSCALEIDGRGVVVVEWEDVEKVEPAAIVRAAKVAK